MFEPVDTLTRLRSALSNHPKRHGRKQLVLAIAQIELISRQLDYADPDELAAFIAAFEEVFPELCSD